MKKMSEQAMRSVNGGYWYCKVCNYKNPFKSWVFSHVIFSGHWMGKK